MRIGNSASGAIISAALTPVATFAAWCIDVRSAGTMTQTGAVDLATLDGGAGLILRDSTAVMLTQALIR